ncbi:MAG: ATP-binding protein, partial [Acidobacteriota bacterium]
EMLSRVCEALRADGAEMLLLTDDRRSLRVRAAVGMDEEVEASILVPVGEGVAGRIAATRQPLLIDDLREIPVVSPILREKFCSLVGAPMMAASGLIGVIHAQSKTQRHFSPEDLRLLQLAAERIAVAIERAQLYKAEQQSRIRAEKASRMKDEFLAVVSHELRSPLNTILGWVTLLRGGRLKGEEAERALETIERCARSQDLIVGDLLDVSRIITGKLQMNIRAIEPAGVIESAVEAVRPAADAKSISLELALDEAVGPVSADSDRLQQMVWNLVSNAIRFTPTGGRIVVSLNGVDSHVEIVVSDTGCGIRPDFLPFIFDRFSQADSSSTRRTGGLGLGLAIVRHLVELHGGEVMVESAGEGRGATFTIKLPRLMSQATGRLASREGETEAVDTNITSAPPLAGLRVLVVDDDADGRELVNIILAEREADVKTASSVAEALTCLRDGSWRPEVLISDIEMPEADGYFLIRQVRAMELDGVNRLPAVALTAYAKVHDRMRAIMAGYNTH